MSSQTHGSSRFLTVKHWIGLLKHCLPVHVGCFIRLNDGPYSSWPFQTAGLHILYCWASFTSTSDTLETFSRCRLSQTLQSITGRLSFNKPEERCITCYYSRACTGPSGVVLYDWQSHFILLSRPKSRLLKVGLGRCQIVHDLPVFFLLLLKR